MSRFLALIFVDLKHFYKNLQKKDKNKKLKENAIILNLYLFN